MSTRDGVIIEGLLAAGLVANLLADSGFGAAYVTGAGIANSFLGIPDNGLVTLTELTDHVVAIFKVRGHWGAVAKSNFTGCRYREPVYRTLRELAMSYFNIYFNLRGERTLRRYSRPVNLTRFDDRNWMSTDKPIWFIAEYLCEIPHISLLTPVMEKNLTRVDRRILQAEMVGHRKK